MKEKGTRNRRGRTQDMIEEGLCSLVKDVEDEDAADG